MILEIKSAEPFEYNGKSNLKMKVKDESSGKEFEATSWNHKLQPAFAPGARIEVKEDDGITWKEYRGADTLSISFKASVTVLSTASAASSSRPAPSQRQAQPSGNGVSGEDVMKRAATLTKSYYDALVAEGFHEADALQLCGNGPQLYPLFWFGEKGMQ